MKSTILIAAFILVALLIAAGVFAAVNNVFSDEQNTTGKTATSTEQTATSTAAVSGSAPDGTYYYVTGETFRDAKGTPGPPTYWVKQKTPNASSTTLLRFTDNEKDRVLDWTFVPDQSEILLQRQYSVERVDLQRKERTVIYEAGKAGCTSRVSGMTVSDNASRIIVGRTPGDGCDAMTAIFVFERHASGEYVQTEKIEPNPDEDAYSFATWFNGTFIGDTYDRMLVQDASCNKGPCPPAYKVLDFTTGDWQWEDDFWDSEERFWTSDLLLPEPYTPASAYALQVGRRSELRLCDPPEVGFPLSGEVIRVHNLQSGNTHEIVGDATDGYRLRGFTTDGSHVLLEQIAHQIENGCVVNPRNYNGFSVLSLKSGDLTSIDDVVAWTQDQKTHVAYRRLEAAGRSWYVDGTQLTAQDSRRVATFLGFARGNQLIDAVDQAQNSDDSGSQTYTNDTYGYTFEYPTDWHTEDDSTADRFGIYNYDISQAEGGHSWPEGHNKIIGGVVNDNTYSASSDFPTESVSTSTQLVADFKTKRVDVTLQGGNQTRTYYIPLRNDADQYLALTIYGDPENFEVLEHVTTRFRFD